MARIAVRAWRGAAGQGRLSPAGLEALGRLPRSRWRTSLRIPLPVSVLLHLALLLALLFFPQRQPRTVDVGAAGTVDVVMLPTGVPEAPVTPEPQPHPTTPEPPVPMLPPTPPNPPPSPPLAAAPAPPAPPPSAAAPEPPAPPPVPTELAAPLPAPPVPPHPAPARPAPLRAVPFPSPIARSLADLTAGATTAPRPEPAPPLPPGSMNLAIGPVARASNGAVPVNASTPKGMVRIEGADLGEDWERALQAWWNRHGFYPRQAAENGEDGTNRVRVELDRTGLVHSVELEMRSGSQWLDMGALAVFRDARLPPFPLATPQKEGTLHLTITYILIRQ
jgi:protein TonB